VTVLFADLKGSMELLADRDPEEARKLLDPVLERMIEAVHRYEGTVNQVMGDGIMALFGAPLAHEDHAVRACYAALDLQAAIGRLAEEARRTFGVELQVRVGLNSGEVVVRAIGNDLHMDYTAVGQTTHLAARMEQLATPGAIRLTADTLRLAEGYVEVKSLGPVPVKGLDGPIDVYDLVAAGVLRSRLHAASARGLTPFVGRDHEMQQLAWAVGQAAAGQGQVVAVVGEPGVGKSRLGWEVSQSRRTDGWLVMQARSVSYGRSTPYLPVIDLLKGYFQVEDRDDPRQIREKVTGKLLALDREMEGVLHAVLGLLDVPVEDAQWQSLDPPQRRQLTLEGITHLLLRESRDQPLLVVFEDLHWIDTETQAFLDSLVESVTAGRLLLLVTYRSEHQHGWGNKTYYTQLRLDPLPPESADELLDGLLGLDATLVPLKRLLIERTEGNPFFLEESVRTLVETHVLSGERGAYRLTTALPSIRVPATVQAVLEARIDRLPAEDKRLLQAAAVVGKDVPFALLQATTGMPGAELHSSLGHLQVAEFLYEAKLFPELEYTFKHALTHEVAYGELLQEQRTALHAKVVEAIRRLTGERWPEHAEALASHAVRGGVWGEALTYLRLAGTRALERSALREAATYFEGALTALQHLPESPALREQAIDLRFDLHSALQPQGEAQRIFEHLKEAEALAGALGDQRRLGRVAAYLTNYFRLTGDRDRAIEWGQRALASARESGDFALQTVTNTWLGQVYFAAGDYQRAIGLFRENVQSLQGELSLQRLGMPQPPAIHSRTCLCWCLAEVGEFAEAVALGHEAVALAALADHPLSRTVASSGLGWVYLRQGAAEQAITALESGLATAHAGHTPLWFPRVASTLACAYALAGRLSEAVELAESAVAQGDSMQLLGGRSLLLAYVGQVYLAAGRVDDARQSAHSALVSATEHIERGHEGWALQLLAETALQSAPIDSTGAADFARRALAVAWELGMGPLAARAHLALGQSLAATADPASASAEFTEAIKLLEQMHMQRWLGPARDTLAQLG